MTGILIRMSELDDDRASARSRIHAAGLPELFTDVAAGHYGLCHTGLSLLEAVELGVAVLSETNRQLETFIACAEDTGFHPRRPLDAEEQRFTRLFSCFAMATEIASQTGRLIESSVRVENPLPADKLSRILANDDLPGAVLADMERFITFHRRAGGPSRVSDAATLANCLYAYFRLLETSLLERSRDTGFRRLCKALEQTPVQILGRRFQGFQWHDEGETSGSSGLLSVSTNDIVGNQNYLRACMRVARDVAGFDMATGRNPKTFNPVLFALGRPGCGKTVTAHAVGNYFLEYCQERAIRARFLVLRRTDWASAYQNASAGALVRIFKEQVGQFDGVVGVYWPDIDTAFAARNDPAVRSEEKNILGASFGIFDGTVLPKNGKWFMMCDANSTNMDDATISRITQEPFTLRGAATPEEMLQLLRSVKLRDHSQFLNLSEEEWNTLGAACARHELSGRSLDNIARKMVTEIEDFEYPREYFSADFGRRRAIVREHSRVLDASKLNAIVEHYARFERESEQRSEQERFDRRVEEIVLNLSANRRALERMGRESRDESPAS